jgi:hypothetical protein
MWERWRNSSRPWPGVYLCCRDGRLDVARWDDSRWTVERAPMPDYEPEWYATVPSPGDEEEEQEQ